MGYRVDYGQVKKVRGVERRISKKASLTALCFMLFWFLVYRLWPEGAELLRNLIFPGDPAVTAAALEELTAELKTGADFVGSLKQFCLTVLTNA